VGIAVVLLCLETMGSLCDSAKWGLLRSDSGAVKSVPVGRFGVIVKMSLHTSNWAQAEVSRDGVGEGKRPGNIVPRKMIGMLTLRKCDDTMSCSSLP
jgi:hypothetical protein